METTKDVYWKGTKPENPIRVIGNPPNKLPLDDIQVLKKDLQWYQDEVVNLERDINDLEVALHEKECEIEDLEEEVDELRIKVETFESIQQ